MERKPIIVVVMCIAVITALCIVLGFFLSRGGQDAAILFNTGGIGLGGLIALLSSTRPAPATTESGAAKVEVQNTLENPVPTEEAKK